MRIELEQVVNPALSAGPSVLDQDRATELAAVLKALGDPVRLRLVALIAAQNRVCVCDLIPNFNLSGATISHHLKVLREAGLIESERKGTWVHYWVHPQSASLIHTLLAV
jgi:ArsR family transcriptional regulator, arsenate/arsenite/antimonite-responsive transcriptional repressor